MSDEATDTTGTEAADSESLAPGQKIDNPDGSKTLILHYPFTHAKKAINVITLPRPKAGQLEVMDEAKGNASATNRLLAELSGLSLMAVRKIDGQDWALLNDIVNNDFLGKSPATGGTS